MSPARWARLRDLFGAALSEPATGRREFVERACADDSALERSLLALLAARDSTGTGMGGPELSAVGVAEAALAGLRAFATGEVAAERFLIESFADEGGMGEVYVAFDLELGERVALKTIRPDLAASPSALAQFKREIQLARRVTHRNVLRLFDLFKHHRGPGEEPVVFVSMELLEGETLARRVRRDGPLPVDAASEIAAQVIEGLDAAHRAGVVHRDLKSANVLLVRDGGSGPRAVILDFGLAAGTARPNDEAADLGTAGTPAYMAPEQVSGGEVTGAADIYSLGVVIFEMLAGSVPLRGSCAEETARLKLTRPAPALKSLVPSAPSTWAHTVDLCLRREVSERPPTARAVAELLTGRRERRRVAAATTAAIVALATALGAWRVSELPHTPSPAAREAADRARVKLQNVTRAGFLEGVAELRRAAAADPTWAEPWADLAYAYAAAANTQQIQPALARSEARAAAHEALRRDRDSPRALGALGWVQSLDFAEWPAAEDSIRRALQKTPDDAQLRYWLAVHLRKKGRFADAEREVRAAITLSRHTEPSYWCELAFLHWTTGRFDAMEAVMGDLLVAFPNFGFTRFLNARLLKERARFDDALTELDFSERLQYSRVTIAAERASVEAHRGDAQAARAILQLLVAQSGDQPVDTLLLAGVHARLGELNEAMDWLERGYERGDSTMLSISTSPVLAPLKGHPRFESLRRRLLFVS